MNTYIMIAWVISMVFLAILIFINNKINKPRIVINKNDVKIDKPELVYRHLRKVLNNSPVIDNTDPDNPPKEYSDEYPLLDFTKDLDLIDVSLFDDRSIYNVCTSLKKTSGYVLEKKEWLGIYDIQSKIIDKEKRECLNLICIVNKKDVLLIEKA